MSNEINQKIAKLNEGNFSEDDIAKILSSIEKIKDIKWVAENPSNYWKPEMGSTTLARWIDVIEIDAPNNKKAEALVMITKDGRKLCTFGIVVNSAKAKKEAGVLPCIVNMFYEGEKTSKNNFKYKDIKIFTVDGEKTAKPANTNLEAVNDDLPF